MRRVVLPLLVLVIAATAAAGDVTLVTYNILNFPGSTGAQRAPHFRLIVENLDPDLLVCQEVQSYTGRNYFLLNVLDEIEADLWEAGPFHDGFDTDRALYYKPALFEVVDSGWLDTLLRDIEWWQLREIESGVEFRVFTLHLKASQGGTNEQKRLAEATILRNFLDGLPADLPVIVAGDLNIYNSYEPAYELMMSAGTGQLHDPIERPGNWHDTVSFADIHTQSTRTASFGGGATGGMDDRFDQILVNDELLDGEGMEILTGTYLAYGNDGNHFNQAIIDGINGAVPEEVADALHESSDHLPVVATLNFPTATPVIALPGPATRLEAWPNPFNPTVSLRVRDGDGLASDLVVHDLMGRQVAVIWRDHVTAANEVARWQPRDLPSGIYFARLTVGGAMVAREKLVLLK